MTGNRGPDRPYGTLRGRTVGILGMAFKAESDDGRASLSYKLRKLLTWAGATVLCTDPYVVDSRLSPLGQVVEILPDVWYPHRRSWPSASDRCDIRVVGGGAMCNSLQDYEP